MISLLEDIADRYSLSRKTGKWVGPCPKCGGSSRSDKFNIRDDGGFKCYTCDFKGDIITWLREMEGKNCPEAHELAGKECQAASCAVADSCRLRSKNDKPRRRLPRSVSPIKECGKRSLPMSTVKDPDPAWSSWAENLVTAATENLKGRKNIITWLANRGIDLETAISNRFGWLPKNGKVNRESISLPPRDDGKKDLWIPAGLVIPTLNSAGLVHRIRVRRPTWLREKFLPKLKYVWIEGSGNAPMVLMPAGKCRGAVIEEAELDAQATAASHKEVMVVALGTVRGPIPEELKNKLEEVQVILVALDADPDEGGKKAAGPEAVADWLAQFRHAKFWPVPLGKDPGEYIKDHAGDLSAWVEAGLIPALPSPTHDQAVNPVCNSLGGRGGDKECLSEDQSLLNPPSIKSLQVGGRNISLVETKEDWQQEVKAGRLVFSSEEIFRLHKVLNGESADSELLLDIKDVFPGAYVSGSRAEV